MGIRRVDEIKLKGKRVFIRVDFNVPLNEKNEITDDTRIVQSLPTIRFVMEAGGEVVLSSHLGRPKGKKDPKFSLAPVADRLTQLLGKKVALASDCIGDEVQKQIKGMKEGEVSLSLRSLRQRRFWRCPSCPFVHGGNDAICKDRGSGIFDDERG